MAVCVCMYPYVLTSVLNTGEKQRPAEQVRKKFFSIYDKVKAKGKRVVLVVMTCLTACLNN